MIVLKQIKLRMDCYLKEHKITRYMLAQKTGIKYQTIDGYYKNKLERYDVYTLSKIFTALDCSLEDIFEIVDVEETDT